MSEIMKEAEVCTHCGTDERDMTHLTRERDEARADAARLRGALEDAVVYLDPELREADKRTPEAIREWALCQARAAIAKATGGAA